MERKRTMYLSYKTRRNLRLVNLVFNVTYPEVSFSSLLRIVAEFVVELGGVLKSTTQYGIGVRCVISNPQNDGMYVLGRDDGALILKQSMCSIKQVAHDSKISCMHRISHNTSSSFVFASGSSRGDVKIWHVTAVTKQLKLQATCLGHIRGIWTMCSLRRQRRHNKTRLATASADSTVRIWDIQSGMCLQVFSDFEGTVLTIAASLNDRFVVYGGDDHTVRISNIDYNDSRILRGHKGPIYKVLCLKSGSIATSSWDRTIRIWDLGAFEKAATILSGHSRCVRDMLELSSNRLLSAADDGCIGMWCLQRKTCLVKVQAHDKIIRKLLALNESQDIIASISDDGYLKVWEFAAASSSQNLLFSLHGHKSRYLQDIACLPRGLVSVCELGSVMEWV